MSSNLRAALVGALLFVTGVVAIGALVAWADLPHPAQSRRPPPRRRPPRSRRPRSRRRPPPRRPTPARPPTAAADTAESDNTAHHTPTGSTATGSLSDAHYDRCCRPSGPARSTSTPSRSPTSRLEIAPGVQFSGWTFAGGAPGPVIHVRQGAARARRR